MRFNRSLARLLPLLAVAAAPAVPAPAPAAMRDVVPNCPANAAWDVDAASATFTGGTTGRPDAIAVAVDKAAVSGRPLSIQTDGDAVLVADPVAGDAPIAFPIAPPQTPLAAADGTVTDLMLVVGDRPAVWFAGRESVRENGHWRRVAKSPGPAVTLVVTHATFAVLRLAQPPPPPGGATALLPAGKLKPAVLFAVARKLDEAVCHTCPNCGGSGTVSVRYEVPQYNSSGMWTFLHPEYQSRVCPVCGGEKVVHGRPEAILSQAKLLVRTVLDTDPTQPAAPEAVKLAYDVVTAKVLGTQPVWDLVTRDARSTLSLAHPRPGTPVIAEVMVRQAVATPAGRRRFLAHLPGTTTEFVVDDPPTADNVAAGPVLMGGLVDHVDPADAVAGRPAMTVVRGTFLIAPDVDRQWSWWVSHDGAVPGVADGFGRPAGR